MKTEAEYTLLAIKCMRGFLDDAERHVSRGDGNPAAYTMTRLGWGMANATGHLETALSVRDEWLKSLAP